MNYHYHEFMIKERRKEEAEGVTECVCLNTLFTLIKASRNKCLLPFLKNYLCGKTGPDSWADHSSDFFLIEFPSKTKGGKAHEFV